jgi:indole-3-glycerol phosphate synthase
MYLSVILQHKSREVEEARVAKPLHVLIDEVESAPPVRSFSDALLRPNRSVGLIAEIKKASPSAGLIRADFDYIQFAAEYADAGADCISVLTDERFFQGKLSFLTEIRHRVQLPLLRKDFIVNPYQIYEARAAGADAVLLIVAALSAVELREYYRLSIDLGMDVLVETHTREEMAIANDLGATLIGINSRNLDTFVTNLDTIVDVATIAPTNVLLVAESAIRTADDVATVVAAGATAILVGESFMRAPNISDAVNRLVGSFR